METEGIGYNNLASIENYIFSYRGEEISYRRSIRDFLVNDGRAMMRESGYWLRVFGEVNSERRKHYRESSLRFLIRVFPDRDVWFRRDAAFLAATRIPSVSITRSILRFTTPTSLPPPVSHQRLPFLHLSFSHFPTVLLRLKPFPYVVNLVTRRVPFPPLHSRGKDLSYISISNRNNDPIFPKRDRDQRWNEAF